MLSPVIAARDPHSWPAVCRCMQRLNHEARLRYLELESPNRGDSVRNIYEHLHDLLEARTPFVSVTVVDAVGSAPQDQGAKMLVTAQGRYEGTVGGGRIEHKAILEAQRLLRADAPSRATQYVDWNLKRDVGMTCGGSLKLFFEAFNVEAWRIVIFGAGHVANALTRLLVELDCRITCYDTREEWLARLPESPRLTPVLSEDLAGEVKHLPDHAFVILMTMGHTTDGPILAEILRTREFPYLGVIGSDAKAMRLKKDMREAGLPPEKEGAFLCPIGLPIGTNHPTEIAVSIVAQLIQERDRVWERAGSSSARR
jgi:xanthine dehydrogenase accessory factor